MNRFSVGRKLSVFVLKHPKILKAYVKYKGTMPKLPKGYRKITKK